MCITENGLCIILWFIIYELSLLEGMRNETYDTLCLFFKKIRGKFLFDSFDGD